MGTLTSWNPLGPSGPVTGLLYLFIIRAFYVYVCKGMRVRGCVFTAKSGPRAKIFGKHWLVVGT